MASSSSDSAATQVFLTDLTLFHIFKNLGVQDLLEFRVVNKKWNTVASTLLKSKPLFINTKKLNTDDPPEGQLSSDPKAKNRSYANNLDILTDFILNNPNFPFLGFTLDLKFFSQAARSAKEFAKSCGQYFKRLRIASDICVDALPEFMPYFSQVEEIHVDYISDTWFWPEEGNKMLSSEGVNLIFPKLRCLIICEPERNLLDSSCMTLQICGEIIEAAPQLQRIENFDVGLTQKLLDCGKLHIVDHLSVRHPGIYNEHLPHLKLFAENLPKLQSVDLVGFYDWVELQMRSMMSTEEIDEYDDKTWGRVERILNKSKTTLTYVRTDFLEDYIPMGLKNVKTLCMIDKNRKKDWRAALPYRFFYTICEPIDYLPELETVRIKLRDCNGPSVKAYFEWLHPMNSHVEDAVFLTVTTLELSCPFDEEGIQNLANVFPNVQVLRVFLKKDTQSDIRHLWQFSSRLKQLEINGFGVDTPDFVDLDSIITGFSDVVCANLRKHRRIACDASDLDVFRTLPSLLNLWNLESLVIHFVCHHGSPAWVDSFQGSNPVSQWYAFELMPKLQTRFTYDSRGKHAQWIYQALQPYSSFVSVLPR